MPMRFSQSPYLCVNNPAYAVAIMQELLLTLFVLEITRDPQITWWLPTMNAAYRLGFIDTLIP